MFANRPVRDINPVPQGPQVIRSYAQPTTPAPRNGLAWKPSPTALPLGSYNPTLDAEREASQRGTANLERETAQQEQQYGTDYNTGVEGINRNAERGLQALATRRTEQQQNFQKALQTLSESYKRLGAKQGEQQNVGGVLEGGAVLQAAAKRAANEGKEKETDTLANTRAVGALNTQEGQLKQDQQLELEKAALMGATPDQGNPLGGRDFQALTNKLTNAQIENQQFGLNVAKEKNYEAHVLHNVPGSPSNQYTTKTGQVYHTISHGNEWWDVTPNGQVIKKRSK